MINCPRCSSPNIVSNKMDEKHVARVLDVAQTVQRLGNKRLGVLAGLGALGVKGINALRKECRCTDCHYIFDYSDAGVKFDG